MGVCGCGKTTVGRALATALGLAVPRRRRFPPARQRRQDGRRHPAHRRGPLAVARPHRRGHGGASTRAAGTRCSPARRCGRRIATACAHGAGDVRFVLPDRATTTRSPRAWPRARIATCRRRCSQASSRRSSRRTTPSSSTSGGVDRRRCDLIRNALARHEASRGAARPRRYRRATAVAHLGRAPRRHLGAVNTPVYRASTILFERRCRPRAGRARRYPRHHLRPARPADGRGFPGRRWPRSRAVTRHWRCPPG